MKYLIPENRIPTLRRALIKKLLQMFDAETTFEISFEEHFNKKDVRLVTIRNKQSEETVSGDAPARLKNARLHASASGVA